MTREEELEKCLCKCWGAMLLADLIVDDPKVKAAFRKVDSMCRKTGLLPRAGMAFIEPPQPGA